MQKAVIIDDERLARNELKKLLLEFPEIEVVGEAANAAEGLEKIVPTRAQFFECGSPNLHSQSIVSAGPPSPSTQKASVADATLAVNLQFTVNTVKPHACN